MTPLCLLSWELLRFLLKIKPQSTNLPTEPGHAHSVPTINYAPPLRWVRRQPQHTPPCPLNNVVPHQQPEAYPVLIYFGLRTS